MKKTLVKSIKISFQEQVSESVGHVQKTPKGFVDRSFDTPKEHLEFHLSNLRKIPDMIRGVQVFVKQS